MTPTQNLTNRATIPVGIPCSVGFNNVTLMSNEKLIFGFEWSAIQAMQQGKHVRETLPPVDISKAAMETQRDVDRFHIPVHMDVKARYAIELPDGYVLVGDTWRFNP